MNSKRTEKNTSNLFISNLTEIFEDGRIVDAVTGNVIERPPHVGLCVGFLVGFAVGVFVGLAVFFSVGLHKQHARINTRQDSPLSLDTSEWHWCVGIL